MTIAHYHLPGLFEFYELYCRFLPLYRNHPEYFYDWCDIGSIYGAPADCLWGGGRVGSGEASARDVLALMRDYGISPRLTFSNSLLRAEHLRDARCNALCRMLNDGGNGGVILHSDLLLRYLQKTYPNLYFVSSTTKVLTSFPDLQAELKRAEFRYVVPDFRLNHALEKLNALPQGQKDKVEFLCNECCYSVAATAARATKPSAGRTSAKAVTSTAATHLTRRAATDFPRRWRIRALSGWRIFSRRICRWALRTSRLRGAS